jgi:hypothetical protein
MKMEIFERIRFARDQALEREQIERQRLADADTPELQQAASVRLATRQSVREALDDILDESSEDRLEKGNSS